MQKESLFNRPVCIVGAGANGDWLQWCELLGIPVLTTWGGMDKIPHDHPLNFGGLGVVGPRLGNLMVQNADLLWACGTDLNQQITGNPKLFASKAARLGPPSKIGCTKDWLKQAKEWRNEKWESRPDWDVCPYKFMEAFNSISSEGDIVVTDAGATLCQTMQGIKAKRGMRIISAWNHSTMGYALPAAIGARLAASSSSKKVWCFIGDGSLMMCLQELATIARHGLNVTVFLFNNRGHGIQRQTMRTWLKNGRLHGADVHSGLGFPQWEQLSLSFGVPYYWLNSNSILPMLGNVVSSITAGPLLVDVMIDEAATIMPMIKAGQRLEDVGNYRP